MKIYGKAKDVFKSIKNICQKNPDMTLEEVLKRGLLSGSLQNTKQFKIGEFPHVYLDDGYEKN